MKKTLFILAILLIGCNCEKPDRLFYKKAEILDIKRDDESQYHLLLKYEDGTVESIADVRCSLKMGNRTASADVPFAEWENCNNKGVLAAYGANSSNYSSMYILIYLPDNYNISLFND